MWTPLLLAATVQSFAHMPLGISDRNNGDVLFTVSCFCTALKRKQKSGTSLKQIINYILLLAGIDEQQMQMTLLQKRNWKKLAFTSISDKDEQNSVIEKISQPSCMQCDCLHCLAECPVGGRLPRSMLLISHWKLSTHPSRSSFPKRRQALVVGL